MKLGHDGGILYLPDADDGQKEAHEAGVDEGVVPRYVEQEDGPQQVVEQQHGEPNVGALEGRLVDEHVGYNN